MATKASTTKSAKSTSEAKPQAVLDEIDFGTTLASEDLKPQPRRSKWVILLDKLWAATEEGKVPRGDDGELRFVKLGAFTNVNGARTQARSLVTKGDFDALYEFKSITTAEGSEMWGRVREVDADEAEVEAEG